MGFLDWLLGRRSASPAPSDESLPPIQRTAAQTNYVGQLREIDTPIADEFPVSVVGESHYQDALSGIKGEKRYSHRTAVTQPQPDNPYDPNAVQVLIAGALVGYLSRADAILYRRRYKGGRQECRAIILGQPIGVRLALDL